MDPVDYLGHHHPKISNHRKTLKNQRHHCDDYRGRCEDPPAWERGTPAGTIGNSWTEEAMMSSNWWCLSSLFTPNYAFFLYDDDLELLIIVIMLHTQYCALPHQMGPPALPSFSTPGPQCLDKVFSQPQCDTMCSYLLAHIYNALLTTTTMCSWWQT